MSDFFCNHLKRNPGWAIIFLLIAVCVHSEDSVQVSVLDDAFEQVGTLRSDIVIPEPWESGLIMAGRQPVLVDAMVNPFYVVPLAHVFGARFRGLKGRISPESLLDSAYEMLHISTVDHKPFVPEAKSLVDALERLQANHHRGVIEARYRSYLEKEIAQWPTDLEEAVSILVQALTVASMLHKEALFALNAEEIKLLEDSFISIISDPSFGDGHLFLSDGNPEWSRNLQLMAKVNFSKLFYAANILTEAVVIARPILQSVATKIPIRHEEILLNFYSPIGRIVVAGAGINTHADDAALLIDLGGNDIYLNNAGGCIESRSSISVLIDIAGNDVYENMNPGSVGAAILGIGMLFDWEGKDTYRSGPLSQGAAIGGVGFLYDERGDDIYHAETFCQGAAVFGIGVSVDLEGDDTTICQSIGQGFGSTLGLGLLINIAGHDTYAAGIDPASSEQRSNGVLTQGAAAGFSSVNSTDGVNYYGGIGFLIDGKGDDQYLAGQFSQGAARFGSMGLLLDCGGDDYYHAGDYSQGAAVDWSSAAIIDLKGFDRYLAGDTSQAVAVNHSTGVCLDYEGDDEYILVGAHGQGHARQPFSLGLFLDYKGFDRYSGGPFSRGSVVNTFQDTGYIIGMFIDHRGKDIYEGVSNKNNSGPESNNTIWSHRFGEIGIDTPLAPELYFSDQQAHSRHLHYDMSPVTDLESGVELSRLGAGDPFKCNHALSFVIDKGKDAIPVIIKAINRGHDSFRRTIEEGLGIIILEHSVDTKAIEQLVPLLDNLDPKTRQWALIQLANHHIPGLVDFVTEHLQDDDASVRKAAAQIAGELNGVELEQKLANMALNDSNPGCRYAATKALAGKKDANVQAAFRKGLRDSHMAIHHLARDQVILQNDSIAIGSLQLLSLSHNPFVRVSSAIGLIKMGEKSGFPVLIDSLDTAPREVSPLDTVELVSEFMAEYSGVNYGWNKEAWQQWWASNEAGFSLERIQKARQDYLELLDMISTMSPVQVVKKLDQLRAKYPFYKGIDRRLSLFVQESSQTAMADEAWDVAGKLVDYLVVMNPDAADTWATQSQYLHRIKRTEEALNVLEKALNKEPENVFYERLKEIYQDTLRRSVN